MPFTYGGSPTIAATLASSHLLLDAFPAIKEPNQIYLDAAMIVNVIAGGNNPGNSVPLTPLPGP